MFILYGLIIMFVGFLIVYKSEFILTNLGRVPFFEKFLGGSRLGYKLVGIVIIFIGIMIASNIFPKFLKWLLSPLLKYSI